MLTFEQIEEIVEQIEYRSDWKFRVENSGDFAPDYWLQVIFFADGEWQHCRKWKLSQHMVPSEIVRTAYKAVLAAEEHEAAERFKYKGEMIYNPHFDVDALAEFSKTGNLTTRNSKEKVILIGDKRVTLTFDGDNVSAAWATV